MGSGDMMPGPRPLRSQEPKHYHPARSGKAKPIG